MQIFMVGRGPRSALETRLNEAATTKGSTAPMRVITSKRNLIVTPSILQWFLYGTDAALSPWGVPEMLVILRHVSDDS